MSYWFAVAMNSAAFSYSLTTSDIAFNLNFLTFCSTGDFVCNNGFALSFAAALVGVMIIIWLFVVLQNCCRTKKVEYEPVFLTLKGFIIWFYVPLAVPATVGVIQQASMASINLTTFLPPVIVLGVLAIFPFLQLLAYKAIQD
jgi:hypothetical protein